MEKKKEFPAFVCCHIYDDSRPVLLVSKEDDDWQFLCGKDDHDENEIPKVVGINHLLSRDKSLFELLNISGNWEAERDEVGGDWKVTPL